MSHTGITNDFRFTFDWLIVAACPPIHNKHVICSILFLLRFSARTNGAREKLSIFSSSSIARYFRWLYQRLKTHYLKFCHAVFIEFQYWNGERAKLRSIVRYFVEKTIGHETSDIKWLMFFPSHDFFSSVWLLWVKEKMRFATQQHKSATENHSDAANSDRF